MDNNKNLYNAMEAVKRITGYKDQWHNADANGDQATKDSVAKKAQVYYKMLENSGYSDIAKALSNTNNVGAKKIYDDFMKNNTVPTTPTTTTPKDTSNGVEIVKSSMPETPADVNTITGKINDLYGIQRSDRETMAKKYDTLEDYNYNHDPFQDAKNKSIMDKYIFKGKTASDNAVASGGASNGGNIDSYAAANANRQQLAFTNAGVNAVLAEHGATIERARGILNDLGVYQQNQDKGMQTTIGLQQGEEQRVFENDETSKNNQVDRDVKTSEVTGYVPESMSYANNPYLNDDGTVIDPENNDFSLIKHNAEEALKNETDPQRIADLKQTIKWAEQARLIKTEMPEYSKWRNTTTAVAPDETLTSKVTNKELDYNKAVEDKKLDTTKELTQAELEAQERMNNADNATTLEKTQREIESAEKLAQVEEDVTWEEALKGYDLSDNAKTLLGLEVYDAWANGEAVDIKSILEANKDGFKITLQDASEIARMFNLGKEVKQWIKDQAWYSEDDINFTPE